jgi:hypothetical protein
MVGQVLLYHNKGDYEARDHQLTRLALLRSELQEIEKHDPELLAIFRNMYRYNRADYYGFRLEVATASLLIRRKIPFEKTERPDFVLKTKSGDSLFIECGSVHLTKGKNRPVDYKLASAINGKLKMPYMNRQTLLFVDVTNIIHHSLKSEHYLGPTDLERVVRNSISGQMVGAVILVFYILDKDRKHFWYNSQRIDNEEMHPSLLQFLDEQFLGSGDPISNYTVPAMG